MGGNYEFKILELETLETLEKAIIVSGTLDIENTSLTIINPIGSAAVVWTAENSNLSGFNSMVTCDMKKGLAYGLYSNGSVNLKHCKIVANADHTANAAGTDYATTSRGIKSDAGSVELYDCYVYGAHSGMTVKGSLKIVGGVYDGFSHGGVYASSEGGKIELYDCEIKYINIPEGYTFDEVAGTNNAAFYIGGASNMNVYVDNCKFYGKAQPIVMKSNAATSYLYISNSTINLDYTHRGIRNDSSNYVHFGKGNNFGINDLQYKRNYEETDLIYRNYKVPVEE